MKKFFALVLAAAMLLSVMVFETSAADVWDGTVADGFASGDGSEATPYVIETGAQLAYLAEQAQLGNNSKGKYYVLGNDIDLNGIAWKPIGGNGNGDFAGNFDGKGYTVSGIKISGTYEYAGLFGIVRGGSHFKDLVIAGCEIDNSTVSNGHAGAAAGYIQKINDISSIVVESGSVSSLNSTGGVFGRINGGNATYIVNKANVTGAGTFGGGISGTLSNDGSISYAVNYGSVTAKGSDVNKYFGGIVGLVGLKANTDDGSTKGGSIYNCYNKGIISATGTKPFVGGIAGRIGENQGNTDTNKVNVSKLMYTIQDVYNLGAVSNSNVGAGAIDDTTTGSRVGEIIAQTATGVITVKNAYSINFPGVALIKHQDKGTITDLENKPESDIKEFTDAIDRKINENLAVPTYTVEFKDGGDVPAQQIAKGKTATKPADPTKDGYTFVGWYNGETEYDFDTPVTSNLTLTAKWKLDTPAQPTKYAVTVATNIQNGTVEADKLTAAKDELVTLTVKPAVGYELDSISVNGTPISGTTFPMPAANVTITATFKQTTPVVVPEGSKDNPIVINTAEQLRNLSAAVAGGNSYTGKYIVLGSDIDLNGQEWTPIGPTEKLAFKGNFDGQGHTVSGIKISNATTNSGGLFGFVVTDGYFGNFAIAESDINVKYYAGAAAAKIQAAEISSITVKEDVTVVSGESIGGVFGRVVGGNLTHIVNYATVRGIYGVYSNSFAGGICGTLGGNATLTYSANYGKVGGALYNGGLAGITGANGGGATVKNCYNRGVVEYTGTENTFVGGIVGSIALKKQTTTHSYENVYNLGTVSKTYNSAKRIGEITGHIPAGTVKLKNVYVLDIDNVNLIYAEENAATISKTNVATKPQSEIELMSSTIVSAIATNAPAFAHAVAFIDNGSAVYTQYIKPGDKVTMPADPIKDGYTFMGWYIGNEAYNFDALVDKDLTLTAKWEQAAGAKDDNIFSSPLFALAALYAQRYEVQLIGENCSISGDTTIKYKRNGTVEINIAEGYELVEVVANGEALGPVTEVTFKKVTGNPELVVLTRAIEKID